MRAQKRLWQQAPLCWLLAVGCGPQGDPGESVALMRDDSTTSIVALVDVKRPVATLASRILVSDPILGRPLSLGVTEGNLVVTDLAGEPAIHVFGAMTGDHLWSEGRQGQGPGEFVGPPVVVSSMTERSSLQWLLDARMRRLVGIDPRLHPRHRTRAGGAQSTTVTPTTSAQVLAAAQIDDANMVITVAADNAPPSILRLHLPSGRTTGPIAHLVALNPEIIGQDITSAMNHTLCASPNGSSFAVLYRYAGAGDLFSASGEFVKKIATPIPFVPPAQRSLFREGMFKSGETGVRLGYTGCTATSTLVFALYSGVLASNRRTREEWHEAYIHVFDWTGRLISVWRLDHGPHAIAVDRSGTTLYSIGDGPDGASPYVRVTSLPQLPPQTP